MSFVVLLFGINGVLSVTEPANTCIFSAKKTIKFYEADEGILGKRETEQF